MWVQRVHLVLINGGRSCIVDEIKLGIKKINPGPLDDPRQ